MLKNKSDNLNTYISLFSSAGVGCYGFKLENFQCVATVELLERRLKVQRYNNKCMFESGYIQGDLTLQETKSKIFSEMKMWKTCFGVKDLDVVVATPPCQGMSVANHKKKDELGRNSLVVESIKVTRCIRPKFFIFENVRAFLTSVCTDIDGVDKTIEDAIERNLGVDYNISCQVLNFKDYGCPSSRTRTLVFGVRKDLKDVAPFDLLPAKQAEKKLREVIGHLPSLNVMGEIEQNDIYHNFRRYAPHMERWISEIKEGESAFDNTDITRIPHRVVDGVVIYNAKKNGDKYTRQYWDKVAPCIHTRSDIMASQNTVHPKDNRVFSIREVMLMMSVPNSFQWSSIPFEKLNELTYGEKVSFLKKEEVNIRQSLGEAVPTVVFQQMARNINRYLSFKGGANKDIATLIDSYELCDTQNLISFITQSDLTFAQLCRIAELANASRAHNAAYYTRQDVCFSIVKSLPKATEYDSLTILEPSIGVGNFLPALIDKYQSVSTVTIDVVDIDPTSMEILRALMDKLVIPSNISINLICNDFLLHKFTKRYDIVVGNPPYKKLVKNSIQLKKYKQGIENTKTNNLYSFFMEKALKIGDVVALIVPKSLINSPEFDKTREVVERSAITHIIDFGETAFKEVKIETICIQIQTTTTPKTLIIESYINNSVTELPQGYITDKKYPYWLIYRNETFDALANKLELGLFQSYRDRSITKSITQAKGKIRILKSRNIGNNEIINIPGYDCYVDSLEGLDVAKYLNKQDCILLPNLTYNPRACFLPKDCLTDGSVAILTLKKECQLSEQDLAFFATEEFSQFYAVARNLGTRSLNIDNNSVFFFGKKVQPNEKDYN